jgi:hypothetical protein
MVEHVLGIFDPHVRIVCKQPQHLLARIEISLAGQINQAHRFLDVARHQPAFEIELSQHDAISQLARRNAVRRSIASSLI